MAEDWHMHAQQQNVRLSKEKIHIFYICHMKGYEASIIFHQNIWHQAYSVFMLLALKKTTKKTYFLHYDL